MQIKTNAELVKAFKAAHPNLDFKKITDYSGKGKMYKTDTRCAFVDYVDMLHRDGIINTTLANNAHL